MAKALPEDKFSIGFPIRKTKERIDKIVQGRRRRKEERSYQPDKSRRRGSSKKQSEQEWAFLDQMSADEAVKEAAAEEPMRAASPQHGTGAGSKPRTKSRGVSRGKPARSKAKRSHVGRKKRKASEF